MKSKKNCCSWFKTIFSKKQKQQVEAFHTFSDDPFSLKIDRETYFALAKMPFDVTDGFHIQLLMRIYTILKGQNEIIAKEKVDWESIGFQNQENITTDFRATGVLGILNLLYLIDRRSNSYSEIRRIYNLSID